MLKYLRIFIILIILLSLFLFWASFGIQNEGFYVEKYEIKPSKSVDINKDTLRILSWNIAWGHGEGSDGTNYLPSTKQDQFTRLKGISEVISSVKADIVLLQEVDLNAARSHHVNQLELLSTLTGIPYKSAISTWKAQYIPYPGGFNFSKHWGFTDSGAGVLSKFPISQNTYNLYPKSTEKSFFYNRFYPFRYYQEVELFIHGSPFRFINNHLEAFVEYTRMQQAIQLKSYIYENTLTPPIVAFGGDFNSVPPTDSNLVERGNSVYTSDSTISILNSVVGYRESISQERYLAKPSSFYTYPGQIPEKRLDYIFVRNDFDILKSEILDTGSLSDHRPVLVEIVLKINSLQ